MEMIDLGGHLYGPFALRVPESAGRFVDIGDYIRAEVSHVAPVQMRGSILLYPHAALSAELTHGWLAAENHSRVLSSRGH